jgi:cell division protein FtsW
MARDEGNDAFLGDRMRGRLYGLVTGTYGRAHIVVTQTARRLTQNMKSQTRGVAQRRHRPDYQIVLFVGLLMLLGLVLMYAIGPQRANVLNALHGTDYYTDTYFVVKQFVSLALAIGAFALMAALPFTFMKQHAERLVWLGLGLCALLYVTGDILRISQIAQCSLGACRWFELGPFGGFQPAELLKFALLLYVARFLGIRHQQGAINDMQRTVFPVVGVALISLLFVVVLQKDLGTGLAISSIIMAMLFVSGMEWRIIRRIVGAAALLGVLVILLFPHRVERVVTFLQGDNSTAAEAQDANYHIKNAKIALGTGGFAGLGIGNSVQATGYLPEAINDSVFAIIGETFGFVGTTMVLVIFTTLLLRILRISDQLTDMSMRLAVAGIWGWLTAHVALNIASMIGVFPLTGITLPLLSFGGTSMVFIAAALGLAFQLSRYTDHHFVTIKEAGNADTRSGRGIGGARRSGRRRYQ